MGTTAVTIQYKATVNNGINTPTAITVPVKIQWGGQTNDYNHVIIANGQSVYLPVILKQ